MPSSRLLASASLLLLLTLAACDRDPAPVTPPPPTAASQPAGDGVAPETSAIVAREGDHKVVIVDVAPLDAKGRKVESASVELDAGATPLVLSDTGLTVELRVPAATRSVKLVGTSVGGATWSKLIPTELYAR